MKAKLIKLIIACTIITGIGTGGYYGYKQYTAKAAVTTNSYMTVSAKKMNMEVNIQGTGAVFAAVSKDVMASNNGSISGLAVNVGDTVKQGSTICVVNDDGLQQNVDKAESDLEKQKLQLDSAKTDQQIQLQNIAINDAQRAYDYAISQRNKMTVTSPIDGLVIAKNYNNGDSTEASKAIVSIIDPNSMKIKVAVDELDIAKVKIGQKAQITIGAIKDKTYEGEVETIAQAGTSTNNVTTYDVVVSIKNPADIKLGMNANVSILVDSKENAITIPAEALIERNGKKYVMEPSSNGSTSNSGNGQDNTSSAQGGNRKNGQGSATDKAGVNGQNVQQSSNNSTGQVNSRQSSAQSGGTAGRANGYGGNSFSGSGKLVEIKTGLENENYIEVLEGVTEGQKLLVALPKVSSTTNANTKNNFGGGMGGSLGGFGGNSSTGRSQGTQGAQTSQGSKGTSSSGK